MTHLHAFHRSDFFLVAALLAMPTAAVADMNGSAITARLKAQTFISAASGSIKPGRCELDFTYSARGDIGSGYAAARRQAIKIRVGMPLSTSDGGTGGVVGAWNGKVQNLGGARSAS